MKMGKKRGPSSITAVPVNLRQTCTFALVIWRNGVTWRRGARRRKRSWIDSSDLYCFSSFLWRPASVKVNEMPRRPIMSATTPTSDNDMFDSPGVLGELGRPEGFLMLLFESTSLRATATQIFPPLPSAHPLSGRGSNTHAYLGLCVKGVSLCVFVGVQGHISGRIWARRWRLESDGVWGITAALGWLQPSCSPAVFIWCRPHKKRRLGGPHTGDVPN